MLVDKGYPRKCQGQGWVKVQEKVKTVKGFKDTFTFEIIQ